MSDIVIRNFSNDDFEGINILMNQVHALHMERRPDIYRKINEPMVWEFNKNAINFYENQGMNTRSRIMEIKL